MLKMIVLGLVAVIATLAGAYAGLKMMAPATPGAAQAKAQEPVELVKLDPTSVPVIRAGTISGYAIVRAGYTATASDIKQMRSLLTTLVGEAMFMTLYGDEGLDFGAMKPLQFEAIGERAAKTVNVRISRDAIKRVAIEGITYLTRDEARNQNRSDKSD